MYKVKNPDPRIIAREQPIEDVDMSSIESPPDLVRQANKFINNLRRLSMPPDKRIKRIYKFADTVYKRLFGGRVVCQRGCAHCCAVTVPITAYEAKYIADNTGRDLHEPDRWHKSGDILNTYCPLLDQDTGTCTAYEFRPLTCRTYGAIDSPKYCADPKILHAIVDAASTGIFFEMYKIIHVYNDNYGTADIRQWFR